MIVNDLKLKLMEGGNARYINRETCEVTGFAAENNKIVNVG